MNKVRERILRSSNGDDNPTSGLRNYTSCSLRLRPVTKVGVGEKVGRKGNTKLFKSVKV